MGSPRSRAEVARFVEFQLVQPDSPYSCARNKGNKAHYGLQEVRELLDFIYGGAPTSLEECVRGWAWSHTSGFKEPKL